MSFRAKLFFAALFILIINFTVYFSTLSPTVQFIDSGELAVVCAKLGIAYPTGYPVFTLLGRIFTLLPLKDVIFRVNLLSLLFVCLGNLILFFVILNVIQPLFRKREREDFEGSYNKIWAAFLATLAFSFTPTLWSQATSNEVYSLNILFYNLVIILLLLWRRNLGRLKGERIFFLLVFLYALSFGNHMSTILLFPALVFFMIATQGRSVLDPKKIILSLFLFVLGFSIYIYLPIRSSQNPLLDWGNPETWSAFKRHITGWQYQVWMFSESAEKLFANFKNFLQIFFRQFPFFLLPLSLLGIYQLFTKDRKIFFFLLILFCANVFYGINYDIPDIDPYFLGSFLVNSVLIGAGLSLMFQIMQKLRINKVILYGIIFCFILVPFILLKKNYYKQDRSQNYLAYDLTSNVLRSVKKDGLILTVVWDHYSAWLYLRYVELKRPDLVFLSEDLCFYSWYSDYVKQNYPIIYKNSKDLIQSYVNEIRKFENGELYDPDIIPGRHLAMLNGFFLRNSNQRPIYDDLAGEREVGKMFAKIPEGLVSSLRERFEYYPYDFPDFELRGVTDKSTYIDERTKIYLRPYYFMTQNRIKYLYHFGMNEEAQRCSQKYKDFLQK